MHTLDKINQERQAARDHFERFDKCRRLAVVGSGGFIVALLFGYFPASLFILGSSFFCVFVGNSFSDKGNQHWRNAQDMARELAKKIKETNEAIPAEELESEESSERGRERESGRPFAEQNPPESR